MSIEDWTTTSLIRSLLPRSKFGADGGRNFAAQAQQGLPRAAHHQHDGLARTPVSHALQQQQLQGQERQLAFSIDQRLRATPQFEFRQRSFVGAINAFNLPTALPLKRRVVPRRPRGLELACWRCWNWHGGAKIVLHKQEVHHVGAIQEDLRSTK